MNKRQWQRLEKEVLLHDTCYGIAVTYGKDDFESLDLARQAVELFVNKCDKKPKLIDLHFKETIDVFRQFLENT